MKISKILDDLLIFSIKTLFLTDIFIFSYSFILRILNVRFPPAAPTGFIRPETFPEPYEIPLYLLLLFICVGFLWLQNQFPNLFTKLTSKPFPLNPLPLFILKIVVFFGLASAFLFMLQAYPMAHNIYPFADQENPEVYFLYRFLFLAFVIMTLFESALIDRLLKWEKKRFIFYGCVVLFIAIVTFEPRFPMLTHDYSYFFGPVWEIVQGKTIYTDVSSQYGFLSVLILALLYKIGLLSMWYLPVLIWLGYIVEYFLIFYLIFKTSKSLSFALIGLFSILTVNYLSLYHLPATVIQIGPMRWLPLIAALFFLEKFKKIDAKSLIFLIALSAFWILDSGMSLLLAFVSTLSFLTLRREIAIKKIVFVLVFLTISILLIFFAINIVHVLLGFKFVALFWVFAKFSQYAKAGFGMIAMQQRFFFWLVPLGLFASFFYLFSIKKFEHSHRLLLFSTSTLLFSSIYFVGRSHEHNLFHIALFFLITVFLLVGIVFSTLTDIRVRFFICAILFFAFIAYPMYQRSEIMTKIVQEKIKLYQKGNIFVPETESIFKQKYKSEIDLIKNNITDNKILILSDDDTYLFYLTEKRNLLYDNSQITILTEKDIDTSLKDAYATCPQKIVADCRLFGKCDWSNPATITNFYIQPYLLEKILTVCHTTYEPTICTNQLCIAEKQ